MDDEEKPKLFNTSPDFSGKDERMSAATGGKSDGIKTTATADLKAAEAAASKNPTKAATNAAAIGKNEKSPASLYTGSGQDDKGKTDFAQFMKKYAPLIGIVGLLLIVIAPLLIIVGVPILLIGTIDYNLQKYLGWSPMGAILESQAIHIVAEGLADGEIPKDLANDFASNGIIIGQVTANGDFFQTNKYIADTDALNLVAAKSNVFYTNGADGELAIMYNDEIISANDFVAKVESDPKLYAAASDSMQIETRFNYSPDVSAVYQDIGLTRNAFRDWEPSGDPQTDQDNFYALFDKALVNNSSTIIQGEWEKEEQKTSEEIEAEKAALKAQGVENPQVSETRMVKCSDTLAGCQVDLRTGGSQSAQEIVQNVSFMSMGGSEARDEAAQLINTAISSNEPRQAASVFVLMESAIQEARAEGDGPVNQAMNAMSRETEISYNDAITGQPVTIKKSIFDSDNFIAVVGESGDYSVEEATNFSRDRITIATQTNASYSTKTAVNSAGDRDSQSGKKKRDLQEGDMPPDVSAAVNSVEMSVTPIDSTRVTSVVGANYMIEGGSYLYNTIGQRTIGAMPSDATAIANYQKEVKIAMDRKAAAERAKLSPFDISSPNTLFGSIAHNFATTLLNTSTPKLNLTSVTNAIASVTNNSANNLISSVTATGDDKIFIGYNGNCYTTKQAANVEGDLYCNSHNTLVTKYIGTTLGAWQGIVNAASSEYEKFVMLGMERASTVGVQSAAVCDAYYKVGGVSLFKRALRFLTNFAGLTTICDGVPAEIYTGAQYTLSYSNKEFANAEKFAAFTMYDTVRSLLTGAQSAASKIREEYYAMYPKDTSPAGQLAEISGMTKEQAEYTLALISYNNYIANYNPAERYAFGVPAVEVETPIFFESDVRLAAAEAVLIKEIAYYDLRNRNFVV